jgi:hypothetical protein
MGVLTRPSSTSITTEIYPEDYLNHTNHICLTLERLGGKWQIELQNRSDEDREMEKLPPEPVRITCDNWNAAIETYLRLLWVLSMSEPTEVWATVRQLAGLSQF